ncbi:ATP-binding cassette domain-containing protein [Halorientalis salina]|uniref:ATP-binding cassette domain-containing protein n=1 Tax=Halorientalis salina TaxID=2932266 RepID=UPI0035587147
MERTNGSGKSTLLKSASNHLQPDDGAVVLDGRSIHDYEQTELAQELGFLSQEHASPESIGVEDLIYHGRYPHRGFFEAVSEADRDALATTDVKDFHENRGRIDYETLLDVDPDVLLLRGNEAKTAAEFEDTVVSFMQNHDSASQLTAVENGDVYRGGSLYQGPITNLVLTERATRQLSGVDRELFDRQQVADIVDGD